MAMNSLRYIQQGLVNEPGQVIYGTVRAKNLGIEKSDLGSFLSTDAGNATKQGSDGGLFTGVSNTTGNLITVTGAGTTLGFFLSAANLVSGAGGNTLGVNAGGLFVPAIASSSFAEFFALMPNDNSATIAQNAPMFFPQLGPASSDGAITKLTNGTFQLASAGTYEVFFQVSVTEPGQLQLRITDGGAPTVLPRSTVGRATGTSQIVGKVFVVTANPNAVLSVINPAGNSTALTITPTAGGASAVSATLGIRRML